MMFALVSVGAVGCDPPAAKDPTGVNAAPTVLARIDAFTLAPESLRVDKIGMRDGALKPDGSLDIVFEAKVTGPAKALFVSTANEKCEPQGGFRASTSTGNEPAPAELGGALELGRMSGGVGVEERGRFLNGENGALDLSAGPHVLKVYIANLGTIRDGSIICAYVISADGTVVRSPPLKY